MKRKWTVIAGVLAATIWMAVTGTGLAQGQYPTKPITIIVPFSPGGSVDRLSRGLATYWSKELGQPVVVQNKPGSSGLVGTQYFLQQPADGYTFMISPASPYICNNISQEHATFTLSDFAFMNAQWVDSTAVFVPKNSKYQTMGQLIDAIKANPGKLSTAQLSADSGMIALAALLDTLGLPQNAVRVVTYDGGGTQRTALAGGQVDFAVAQAQGTKTIEQYVRLLTVFQDDQLKDWPPAPTIHTVLKPYGVDVPNISGSVRTLVASAKFKQDYPDRFQFALDAYHKTLENPDFQAWLKTNDIEGTWRGPEASTKLITDNCQVLQKYQKQLGN